jgi:hypothetical protein
MPAVTPQPVKTSEKAEEMLKFDLENEKETIRNYRRRVKQAEELNEFAIAESLRGILVQEQDHLNRFGYSTRQRSSRCGDCRLVLCVPATNHLAQNHHHSGERRPGPWPDHSRLHSFQR